MPSLREQLTSKKAEEADTDCHVEATQPPAFIQFEATAQVKLGFAAHQLLHYTLEPSPEIEHSQDAPPERLTLGFSTADVVLLGWRLAKIADLLRDQKLASVRAIAERYANLAPNKPCVTDIKVVQVGK